MVLGLIDFLLGGKKKTKVPRNAQVATPSAGNTMNQNSTQMPDGQSQTTQNHQEQQSQSNSNQQTQSQPTSQNMGGKRSVSDALQKLYGELKESNEKMNDMSTNIKSLQDSVNTLGHRVDDLEEKKKQDSDKLNDVEEEMSKFLSLYELINNQYNPFVSKEEEPQAKKIVLDNTGESSEESSEHHAPIPPLSTAIPELKHSRKVEEDDLDSTLLELDTLNIEEAAGNAVPLTRIKNNTNSLVVILSWLEYLIKKVGLDETRNTLRYYTEVLRWITPEVYFDLDKYLRGMKDKKDIQEDNSLSVRDHIVSLYFISKLNEKTLDEKLTRAVLQIIKQ